jgi:hypothetical protein
VGLSTDLISQFAKLTANKKQNEKTETFTYGKVIKVGNETFVQLDGSEVHTPAQSTVVTQDGDRVSVMIKDHTATITGNASSPAARNEDVETQGKRIDEFDVVVAYKVSADYISSVYATIENIIANMGTFENIEAVTAQIETLKAKFIFGESLTVDDITAINAEIESLRATFAEISDLEVGVLDAVNAEIDKLVVYTGTFTNINTEVLDAVRASIDNLTANKLDVNFANIDYANIDKATFKEFYAKSGLIQDVYVGDATVTGYLVGVTIKGDLIEAGTLVADKLVIKSDDGLYYKLNFEGGKFTDSEEVPTDSLHGSVITAKSITAEKVSVGDLVAFDATIGGFEITSDSIHSFGKDSADNFTKGVYFDNDGQFFVGDNNYFLRYYNDKKHFKVELDSATNVYVETETKFDNKPSPVLTIAYNSEVLLGSFESGERFYYSVPKIDPAGKPITPTYYRVTNSGGIYVVNTSSVLDPTTIIPTLTDSNEQVFLGKDSSGNEIYYCEKSDFKLEISAESILFGVGAQSSAEDLKQLMKRIKMGTYPNPTEDDPDNTDTCIELSEGDSKFKQVITNAKTMFMDGEDVGTTIDKDGVNTKNASVDGDFRQGNYVWAVHGTKGNYGLIWKEANN